MIKSITVPAHLLTVEVNQALIDSAGTCLSYKQNRLNNCHPLELRQNIAQMAEAYRVMLEATMQLQTQTSSHGYVTLPKHIID